MPSWEKLNTWRSRNNIQRFKIASSIISFIKSKYPSSLEHVNQVVVLYPWFTPALTEKARVLIIAGEWEQAMECVQRVVAQVRHLLFYCFYILNLI